MSVKSIGYQATLGRGGKYVVPNLTVNSAGQIINAEVSDVPQLVIAGDLQQDEEELEALNIEYLSLRSGYEATQSLVVNEENAYNLLQTQIDTLSGQVTTLSTNVNTLVPSQVVLNYDYNSTPFGLYGPLNQTAFVRAGPIDYSFAAPVLGNYIRSILYDYEVAATGTYHLRISMTLTQQLNGNVDWNGVPYSARAMVGASNQVALIFIYVGGSLHSTMTSCNWDYFSTQIYINGAKFLQIQSGQTLSVGVAFVSDVSNSLDIPSKQIGFFWNLSNSTGFVEPPISVNQSGSGNSVLKLTYVSNAFT